MTLRYLVEEYLERYEQASKTGKSEIAYEIVAIVHGRRGRFLKPNDDDKEDGTTSGNWLEVEDPNRNTKGFLLLSILSAKTTKQDRSGIQIALAVASHSKVY
jgi:hypothetical protein